MSVPWTEYMRRRVKHEEKGTPWWVNNKTTLNAFCVENGIPAPSIFRVWDDPAKIEFNALPEVFVLKPNLMSSSSGVMVLKALGGGDYYDSLNAQTVTLETVIDQQAALFEKTKYKKSYRVFAEELVLDAKNPALIPLDYKIYCFYDRPMLVQQIDRNVEPTATAFFDGNFTALDLDSKIESRWKHYQLGEPMIPATAQQMLEIAGRLTKQVRTPFMRVDMYNSTRGPLVGELTPAPGGPYHGALYKFTEAYDMELGDEWAKASERIERDAELG